jgi:hypothetical protein
MSSDRTPFSRMLPSVIGSIGSLKRSVAIAVVFYKKWSRPRRAGGHGVEVGTGLMSSTWNNSEALDFVPVKKKTPRETGPKSLWDSAHRRVRRRGPSYPTRWGSSTPRPLQSLRTTVIARPLTWAVSVR